MYTLSVCVCAFVAAKRMKAMWNIYTQIDKRDTAAVSTRIDNDSHSSLLQMNKEQ